MSTTLINKLKLLETAALEACSAFVSNGKDDCRTAAGSLLEFTRFVMPLAQLLEEIAPHFDFADVKANGYRSMLAVLDCSINSFLDPSMKTNLAKVDEDKVRAYAQCCEMVLYGAFLYCYTKHYDETHESETANQQYQSLFPKMGLVQHACYQQMAAKCNADIDIRNFQAAGLNFGLSFPLRVVMRFIQTAIVSWGETQAEWLAMRSALKHKFGCKLDESQPETDLSKDQPSDLEFFLRDSLRTVAEVVYTPFLVLKGLAKASLLSLPISAINRLRADKACNIEELGDVGVIQHCWNQTESTIIHASEMLLAQKVGHVEVITLQLPNCSVQVRIICPFSRCSGSQRTKCSRLILHAHGGGFIAQTSKSHEVYLRRIANELQSPIVSIDYSTAPQQIYPIAVEECFAVYKWILQNQEGGSMQSQSAAAKLKNCSTCENVCFLGDSAGGNLMLCVLQRCILDGVPVPRGYVGVYSPLLLQFAPSPSRMVPYADAFIPNRTLAMCLVGYFGYDLRWVLHEVERDCKFHEDKGECAAETKTASNHEQEEQVFDVNGLKLCPDCAHLKIAGNKSTMDLLLKLDQLRAPLFGAFRYGGTSQHWRNSCALAKLQYWTEFVTYPLEEPRKKLTPDLLHKLPEKNKPTAAPLHWPDSVLKMLPKTVLIIPGVMDATVDDNVEFAKRLAAVGTPVKLEVVHDVSHGFLNFSTFCPNSMKGLKTCIQSLHEMLDN